MNSLTTRRAKFWFLFVTTACIHLALTKEIKEPLKNWGSVISSFSNFSLCKGPKKRDLTDLHLHMVMKANHSVVVGNYTLDHDVINVKVVVQVFFFENDRYRKLWTLREGNVCSPIIDFITILRCVAEIRKDGKFCVVKRVVDKIIYFDLNKLFDFIHKKIYFRGQFKYKVMAQAPNGNLFCLKFFEVKVPG